MSHLVTLSPGITFDEVVATKGSGYKPDFRVFSSDIFSDQANTRRVRMIGSSTVQDLQGDTMTLQALDSMTKVAPNLTIWLNHDYTLPDSIFGSLVRTPTIIHRDGIADLELEVDVELDNPNAAKVKRYIDNGRRLGCSIGCMVTKYEVPDEEDGEDWYQRHIKILEVYTVEYSVVGIPANQRSWVENAIRGVFTRTYDPYLVPAMKSLWPSAYRDLLKHLPDVVQGAHGPVSRSLLERAPERTVHAGKRIDWRPDRKSFYLSINGKEWACSRDMLARLFNGDPAGMDAWERQQPVKDMTGMNGTASFDEDMLALGIEEDEFEVEKGVCGSTSWPLDMESSWDKSSAHARLLEWAGGKEHFSPAKFKKVHFWYDNNGENISDYSYPFCDIKDGKVKAIFRAITAAAAAVAGARSGEAAEGSKAAAIRRKLAVYYRKAGKTPPWEDSGDEERESDKESDEEKRFPPSSIQRYALNADGTRGVALKETGDHEPYRGRHTHHHRSFGHGDVDMHTHEHYHDGDSEHHHDHSHVGMGEHPLQYALNADGTRGVALKANGDHEDVWGTHTHHHESYGHGDTTLHSHEHVHHGDHDHHHDHAHVGMGEYADRHRSLDASQARLLASYNALGEALGLPSVSQEQLLLARHPLARKHLTPELLRHAQRLHDTLREMTEGVVCNGPTSLTDAEQQAAEAMGEEPVGANRIMNQLIVEMQKFSQSLQALDVLALKAEANQVKEQLVITQKELDAILAETREAAERLAKLKAMPLGKPTSFERTVRPEDHTVSYDDLLSLHHRATPVMTQQDVFAQTEVCQVEYANGQRMTYRYWPDGVGGDTATGLRPPLTPQHIQFMTFDEIKAYREGKASRVPYLGNQVESAAPLTRQ